MLNFGRSVSSVLLSAAALATIASIPGRAAKAGGTARGDLGLDDARDYVVNLINHDREAAGMKPVQLDPIATSAGQKHAEEMALNRYLSHWNREGKLPDQRYTDAGGKDLVMENVFLDYHWSVHEPAEPLELDKEARYSTHELEDMEAAYFNQRPPYDSHRKNILDRAHTHVGIGLAKARREFAIAFSNSMEFVNRWISVDPIPAQARVGDRIVVAGQLPRSITLRGISIGRDNPAARMSIAELKQTRHYHAPSSFVTYRREAYDSPRPVTVDRDGRFRVEVTLSDEKEPGIYYVSITVADEDDHNILASRRTIVVK